MKFNTKFLLAAGLLISITNLKAQSLVRFYENYKVGYKDPSIKSEKEPSGHVVVPAKYYAGSEFINGYAIIMDNNKRGFLNEKGEVAIPLQYEDAGPFVNGVAKVMLNHKYGFINTEGKWAVEPKYDFADDFSEGFAVVALQGKYGFLNKDLKEGVPLTYESAKKFSNSLAAVRQGGVWGYINKQGAWEIKAQYENANFFNSNQQAQVTMNHKFYLIDAKGNIVKEIEMKNEEEFERGHRTPKATGGVYDTR